MLVGLLGSLLVSASCAAQAVGAKGMNETTSLERRNASSSLPGDTPASSADRENSLGLHFVRNLAEDQKAIWTGFTHLRLSDADWLLPLGMATGGMLATDTEASKHLSNSANRVRYSKDFSNYGLGSLAAAGGGLYLWGRMTHDDHKREAGLLAAEAALNSLAVTYAVKRSFGRERPLQDSYRGSFGQGGDSFPSEHASMAWSIASVVAHEYPGPLTTLLSYGLASAVSASRISSKQHFPSDVLIGSAVGWFVGREVYRRHHDPELGGGNWETYAESREEGPGRSAAGGSRYVELDSWIYPAIERLAALGYIHSAFLGMRPWTRLECARLVEEAGEQIEAEGPASREANRLYVTLAEEFQESLETVAGGGARPIRLESVYGSVTGIGGPPLNDSYHLGQTIINNYGRPYQRGFNGFSGFSGYAAAGRFTIYVRGEYQQAPSAAAYPLSVRQVIAALDGNPVQSATPVQTTSRFKLLDTYVGANAAGWDLAFGKQSLWWGPGKGGAFLFSNNAEPIYMFRASRIAPFTLPWILRRLGPMKVDAFVGKLSGHEFPPRPLIHGEKISFKPTENLELGFSRTVVFGGVGRPITFRRLWWSYVSATSSAKETPATDPGKRTGGFDFSYKVPFVRNWLTVYTDSLADDDPSPLANPPRAGIYPGIYMPRLPKLPNLDFRAEAVYTNTPRSSNGGHYIYFDHFYTDLYTNKKNLMGHWIGREGMGFQAWSTYWFSRRNSVQFGYRHSKVSADFIPGGETLDDGSVNVNWWPSNELNVSARVQCEKWLAPILAPGPQTNWTSSVEVTFFPRSWSW
jgi:hypothetical protein